MSDDIIKNQSLRVLQEMKSLSHDIKLLTVLLDQREQEFVSPTASMALIDILDGIDTFKNCIHNTEDKY